MEDTTVYAWLPYEQKIQQLRGLLEAVQDKSPVARQALDLFDKGIHVDEPWLIQVYDTILKSFKEVDDEKLHGMFDKLDAMHKYIQELHDREQIDRKTEDPDQIIKSL